LVQRLSTWRRAERGQTALSIETAQPRAAISLVRRDGETGVAHPERLEQPGAEELAEAHAGELFDEITSAPIVINK